MQLSDRAEAIDRHHLLRTSLDLVAIGSRTGYDEAIGRRLVAHFSDLGCSISVDETSNVVALGPGTRDGTGLLSSLASAGTSCWIARSISDDGLFRTEAEAGLTAMFQPQSTDRPLETHMPTEPSPRAMP